MAEGEITDVQTLPNADWAKKQKELEKQITKIKTTLAHAAQNLKNTDPFIMTRELRREQKENSEQ